MNGRAFLVAARLAALTLLGTSAAQAQGIGISRLALEKSPLDAVVAASEGSGTKVSGLGAERARILLQSLTVPGWGQATMGHTHAAALFAFVETGIWAGFVTFRIQESMREDSYLNTAQLFAGIDLSGKDEEYRRTVGEYPSSDEYNRLVVYRDAANLYYNDPAKYREYIAQHQISGSDAWSWNSYASFQQYAEERKQTRRAGLRANSMLGLAIANRLVSAIHAARHAGAPPKPAKAQSWRIDCGPAPDDLAAMRVGVSLRY
jgi:hypothetical protein